MDGELTPIFNRGFSWEIDVDEPADWPVSPGANFTFHRATMLHVDLYSPGEVFSIVGSITHADVTPVTHRAVIAHYDRFGVLQDFHKVSSHLVGEEDSLVTQSLQDGVVGDMFYFAITPAISDLRNFNYNLGSLDRKRFVCFDPKPGETQTITIPFEGQPAGQSYFVVVKQPMIPNNGQFSAYAACGGGGGGDKSSFPIHLGKFIGGGGGGGGAGPIGIGCLEGMATDLSIPKGSIIELYPGLGGKGGTNGGDGSPGESSFVKVNGELIDLSTMLLSNPFPGGLGGQGGGAGGNGAGAVTGGEGGGGGGANLSNFGIPNFAPGTPGVGGPGQESGGTDPRKGGDTFYFQVKRVPGGKGGDNSGLMGSGGGAGGVKFGGLVVTSGPPSGFSEGGDGGGEDKDGNPGNSPELKIIGSGFSRGPAWVGGGGGGGGGGEAMAFGGVKQGGDGGKGTDAWMQLIYTN